MSEIKYGGAVSWASDAMLVFAFPCADKHWEMMNLNKQKMFAMTGYHDDGDALCGIAGNILQIDLEYAEGDLSRDEFMDEALNQCTFASLVTGTKYWAMDVVRDGSDVKKLDLHTFDSEEEFRVFVADRGEPITWM